jgi:predicted O-linked N-acetylglucosamine transferase (SPINDLY family)
MPRDDEYNAADMSSPPPADLERLKVLLAFGDEEAATALAEKMTRRYPGSFVAWNAWGGLLGQTRQFGKALQALRRATALAPANPLAHTNLGNLFATLGKIPEAVAEYRQALKLQPSNTTCWSNLLFAQQHWPEECSSALQDALDFAAHARAGATPFTAWRAAQDGAPLRVGMVSGDLREHPVGYFLDGVCAHLDPREVTLLAYPTSRAEDALTARLRRHFAGWMPIDHLSDAAAAAQIHDQALHILIDLSGHTALNRLPVFAWRPAPVQVSWLGYVATTGLQEMDYLLADPVTVPVGRDGAFVESIWRMPQTRFCFSPPDPSPPVAPTPALGNGFVTYGSFNRLSKINDSVLSVWARVLRATPGSRLRVMMRELSDPAVRRELGQRAIRAGLDPNRLDFDAPLPRDRYLEAYGKVDIALDPFPFTGGTTTVEALWMGVPVLTIQGDRLVERQGAGLLQAAGLAQWIAFSTDDYVARAAAIASRVTDLSALRGQLRERFRASAACDSTRFAQALTNALREMWHAARPRIAAGA